jgi:multidrug efflux pump
LSVAFVFLILAALYESWAFPVAVILVVPVCVACSLGAVWLTDPGSAVQMFAGWGLIPDLKIGQHPPAEWLPAPGIWEEDKPVTGPFWFRIGYWIDYVFGGPLSPPTGYAGWRGISGWLLAHGIGKQDVNIFTQVGFVVLVGLACKNAILIVEFAKVARDRGEDPHVAVLEACKLRFRPIMMTSVAFMLGVLPLAVARGAGAEMRQALGVAVLGGMLGVTAFGIGLTPVFFVLVDRLTELVRRAWAAARGPIVAASYELAVFVIACPGLFVVLDGGVSGLRTVIVRAFVLLAAAVALGIVGIAAVETERSIGAVDRFRRAARRVRAAARRLGASVRNIRTRGGAK